MIEVEERSRTARRPSPRRLTPRRWPRSAEYDWAAAGWAGLAAGAVMILLEVSLGSLFGDESGVDPVRRIAAIALGESVAAPLSPFTALVFFAAMGVHLPLSLLYARLTAVLVRGLDAARAAAVGAGFGVVLYAVNYYALTDVFPWFADARGWVTLVSHVAFGLTAGAAYAAAVRRPRAAR